MRTKNVELKTQSYNSKLKTKLNICFELYAVVFNFALLALNYFHPWQKYP